MTSSLNNIKSPTIKLALTGGPSGGKTTLLDMLKKEMGTQVSIVPEAASILYRGGFPRLKSLPARKSTQKAIYYTQKELENLVLDDKAPELMLCDRGSLDGIAYWPLSESDFMQNLGTTRTQELARYDWLLHLDTAGAENYETTNPVRTESFLEALDLNAKIKEAWAGHPKRVIIPQQTDFLSKMTLCVGLVRLILQHKPYEEVAKYVAQS